VRVEAGEKGQGIPTPGQTCRRPELFPSGRRHECRTRPIAGRPERWEIQRLSYFTSIHVGVFHMAVPATQIRRGMVIVFEGEPVRVVEFRHHTPGNLRAMVQAKLKSLRTGSSFEHRFRAADSIEPASMETHELEYMYDAGGTFH